MKTEKRLEPIGCDVSTCSWFARVAIREPNGRNAHVCVEHLGDALDASAGHLAGMELLDCPKCARPGCRGLAVTRVDHGDGSLLLVCQQHLDDLSWVAMPNDLLSDLPGWSHE